MRRVYLDYNAATQADAVVQEAFTFALQECWGNASSSHKEGQAAKALLASARHRIANCFGVEPIQVTFFSTATEALYTLIQGLLVKGPNFEIITSVAEHVAVWQTCSNLVKDRRSLVAFAPVGEGGAVTPEQLEKLLKENTSGIALMSVNNETGVMTDIESCAQLAKERKVPFLVDGVAQLGKSPIKLHAGVSAICFSSYKIHGPCGVGFCITNKNVKFSPLFEGGGQEFGRRGGSPNVPAIHACSIAVEHAFNHVENDVRHMRALRDDFEAQICKKLHFASINGTMQRVCNTSNMSFDSVDGETLLIQLDRAGVAASHGAACSAGAMEPSRVLLNMGYTNARAASSVRFSLGKTTTKDEIDFAVHAIIESVRQQVKVL